MNIVQRAVNILTKPKLEWPRIDAEPATTGKLLGGYALPVALLPFIVTVLFGLLFDGAGELTGGGGVALLLVAAVLSLLLGLALTYVMSLIASALAPNFGGEKDKIGALKLLVYSGTAVWVASALSVIPFGWLIGLLGYVYAAYLIYLGSTAVMKVPQASALGYTAVVIIIWIALSFLLVMIIAAVLAAMFFAGVGPPGLGAYR